ncbi:MAG: hypothetical protein FMLXV1_gp2 [Fushun monolepta lauta xinmovirus 1]|uniref:Uncharacterized protein n=1 Tax=Fushun monolepta lauta xinmovirus 1 TaxID=2905554 RepID=A0A8K1XH10_9MONO|nr:MAG: hypothetical protein FMLXV1_gp2 [Fushun monolepta lauta xinmovirus 1]
MIIESMSDTSLDRFPRSTVSSSYLHPTFSSRHRVDSIEMARLGHHSDYPGYQNHTGTMASIRGLRNPSRIAILGNLPLQNGVHQIKKRDGVYTINNNNYGSKKTLQLTILLVLSVVLCALFCSYITYREIEIAHQASIAHTSGVTIRLPSGYIDTLYSLEIYGRSKEHSTYGNACRDKELKALISYSSDYNNNKRTHHINVVVNTISGNITHSSCPQLLVI